MSHLVIVESPAKARTIGNYLGDGYTVMATMGHVRDLPKSVKGVDVDAGFVMRYEPIAGKAGTIHDLKTAALDAEKIFLATDPDREGEAISWHLKEILGLDDDRALRVTFNEITKREVQSSIQKPRQIDYQLVDAQQARRALDRIVGYEVSPVLWRKIKGGLSAGRVQSVACRLVVDRENEIRAFTPVEYWTLEVTLQRVEGQGRFVAQYFAPLGSKKVELHTQEEAQAILSAVQASPFSVLSVTHSDKKRSPAPPFTTSTLQQEASRRLGMVPKRTMSIAQQLYEGISVHGHGLTGLITYMRTDSLRLSDEAVADVRRHIEGVYGKAYLPSAPRVYKSKAGAQDAHEAIRPSYIDLPPDQVKSSLTTDQYKLYKLIWDRFVSCQMENALYDLLTIDSASAGHVFRANHTSVKFAGFTAVYVESREEDEDEAGQTLPDLKQGEALRLTDTAPEQHFTKPPARYTEASLIRAMEEKGIGRPSTYAPTISTISDREYVVRENRQLRPTQLGEAVTAYMVDKFNDIVDVEFTARMENDLDQVEEGKKEWKAMLSEFYGGFSKTLEKAISDQGRVKIPDEKTDQICSVCGRNMVIRVGRFGRYMACEGYPDSCKNTRPLSEETPGLCPLCGAKILKKKSKRGFSYFGCEKAPSCSFITWDTPVQDACPTCGKTLFKNRTLKVPFCENPACAAFVPEDQRGYRKKKTEESGEDAAKSAKTTGAKKPGAKTAGAKTTTKKPASKAATAKAAIKKTATKKPAVKAADAKTASKTAVKTPRSRKPAPGPDAS